MILLKKTHRIFFLLAPVFFGIWSYLLGQDRNADLINYHLYNAFAFLNNKNYDFAVAGLQSFFNPLIDLPYYFLITHLKGEIVAFLMGFENGLVFILIYLIGKECLIESKNKKKYLLFLSLAGCLTPNFLANLGNSMGDNLIAPLNLLALLLSIKSIKSPNLKVTLLILSGLIIGFSSGLKLTNATFALTIFLSIIFIKKPKRINDLKPILVFAIAVLIGLAITGGFWYLQLFREYQNPIFPLLNNLFPNPYFENNPFLKGNVTKYFGPKNFIEYIFWPFISSIEYHRFGRGLIHFINWPIIYILIFYALFLKHKNKLQSNFKSQESFYILSFILLSYIINFTVFKIQRYSVTFEVLTPLAIFILVFETFPNRISWRISKSIILTSIVIVLIGGFGTWGHTSYTHPTFNASLPITKDPEKTLVILPDLFSPVSWIVTLFNPKIAFFRLEGIPNTNDKFQSLLQNRKGEIYMMTSGYYNWRKENIAKWNSILTKMNLLHNKSNCDSVQKFIKKINFRGQIEMESGDNSCHLILSDRDNINEKTIHENIIADKKKYLKGYELILQEETCQIYPANTGGKQWRYVWCTVKKI
jgi:hypothetical protein